MVYPKYSRNGIALAVLSASIVGSTTAYADDVLAGFDYFMSVPGNGTYTHTFESGTWFNFTGLVPGLTFVDFEGVPVGPGDTDTIVERLDDAIFPFEGTNHWPGDPTPGTDTLIDIELVALSLKSIEPVVVGGYTYDIFISLDPLIGSPGWMELQHQWADSNDPNPEGTFDSLINVWADIAFIPLSGGEPFQLDIDGVPLESQDSLWSHTPGGGFDVPQILEWKFELANHPVVQVVVPEPATFMLLAFCGLSGFRRRR